MKTEKVNHKNRSSKINYLKYRAPFSNYFYKFVCGVNKEFEKLREEGLISMSDFIEATDIINEILLYLRKFKPLENELLTMIHNLSAISEKVTWSSAACPLDSRVTNRSEQDEDSIRLEPAKRGPR